MATALAEIPAGGTFIDTFKKSFVDVPVDAANDNAVETTAFLEAAESLTTMFGTAPVSGRFYSGKVSHANRQTSSAVSPSPPSRTTCSATSRYDARLSLARTASV